MQPLLQVLDGSVVRLIKAQRKYCQKIARELRLADCPEPRLDRAVLGEIRRRANAGNAVAVEMEELNENLRQASILRAELMNLDDSLAVLKDNTWIQIEVRVRMLESSADWFDRRMD